MNRLRLSGETVSAGEAAACEHAERMTALFRDLCLLLPTGTQVRRDESLARRTTLRVGGPADVYVEPPGEAALAETLAAIRLHRVPFFILGRGSNLLVRDGGFRGAVICLNHPDFSRIDCRAGELEVGAGARARDVAHAARRAGLSGLEFLEGIPGAMGGLLRMNAGAMGSWVFDRVTILRCMDSCGNIVALERTAIPVSYRSCPLLKDRIALSATLKGLPEDPDAIQQRMTEFSQRRWATQPHQPSGGCTFKNPSDTLPAGRLIQELNLKGHSVGDAMISEQHGNFFINRGHATAADVLGLIDLVRERAFIERGIHLETELEIVGED